MVITVKGTYTIKPAKETPKGLMLVSDIDLIQPLTHVATVFLFQKPPSPPCSYSHPINPLETTKHSLSKALSIFYPLAGRLKWTSPTRERLQIDCNSAGALLVDAESDSTIHDLGDFCPTAALMELLPPLDYQSQPIEEIPLLLVQITTFSCGGICLGLRLSHVLVDGASATHFTSIWSRIALGEEEPQDLPFFERTLLKPPQDGEISPASFDKSQMKNTPLIIGRRDDREERRRETAPVILKLSKGEIDMLKDMANVNNSYSYTRFVVLSAHVWRCASKARALHKEQQTAIRVAVNIRNRIKPNLPELFFGNAVVPVAVTTTAGELLAEPLSYACGKIRDALNKVDHEFVQSCLGYLKNEKDLSEFRHLHVVGSEKGPFFGNPNMSVTSWLTALPLTGTDFGWGKDIHMGPALLGSDGKSFFLPTRDGDGSIVVALRLRVDHMDAFKKFFYGDIE